MMSRRTSVGGWLVVALAVWFGVVGDAAAQLAVERTAPLPREGNAACTVVVRGAGAVTLRCPGEHNEGACTAAGLADVVPGEPVEQLFACEHAVIVIGADGAPLGGGSVENWDSGPTIAVLDVISDDADELLVRTSGSEDHDISTDRVYVLKWRGSQLVPIYERVVGGSAAASAEIPPPEQVRVEITLSRAPRITEEVVSQRGRREPVPAR